MKPYNRRQTSTEDAPEKSPAFDGLLSCIDYSGDNTLCDIDLLEKVCVAESRAAKAENERDIAVDLCGKLIALCSPPKEWEPKLFRRHINRPGDYMGCGYDFLDSFNRIFNNFTETADDEVYTAIRQAAEKEILERTRNMIG